MARHDGLVARDATSKSSMCLFILGIYFSAVTRPGGGRSYDLFVTAKLRSAEADVRAAYSDAFPVLFFKLTETTWALSIQS